jgi:ADP-ribose pyrophosphatase YjhB (NUDIX family)
VEAGETTRDALGRELEEEAGIGLTGPVELFGLYFSRHVSRRDHVAVYVCREWRQERQPKIPNLEVAEIGFYATDSLPDGTTSGTRRRIGEIVHGQGATVDW